MSETGVYQPGTLVVYGGSGVCRVETLGIPDGQEKTYYTLRPLYGTEVIYVPVDTRVYMRPVFTRREAEAFIQDIPGISEQPVEQGSLQMQSRQYQAALQSHEAVDLVRLLKTIERREAAARRQGRQPGKLEEKYRKRAEDLLYGELAASLDIPRETVPQYIRRALKTKTADPMD